MRVRQLHQASAGTGKSKTRATPQTFVGGSKITPSYRYAFIRVCILGDLCEALLLLEHLKDIITSVNRLLDKMVEFPFQAGHCGLLYE